MSVLISCTVPRSRSCRKTAGPRQALIPERFACSAFSRRKACLGEHAVQDLHLSKTHPASRFDSSCELASSSKTKSRSMNYWTSCLCDTAAVRPRCARSLAELAATPRAPLRLLKSLQVQKCWASRNRCAWLMACGEGPLQWPKATQPGRQASSALGAAPLGFF